MHQGINTDVKVTIDAKKIYTDKDQTVMLPTLWARLHVDNDVKGVFEWGLRGLPYNDPPVVENGHEVVAEFGTSADQATAPNACPRPRSPRRQPSKPVAAPAPST